jgi:hypothetical protein
MAKYYCDLFNKKIIKLEAGESAPIGLNEYTSWKECYENEASKPDYDNTYFQELKENKFKKIK